MAPDPSNSSNLEQLALKELKWFMYLLRYAISVAFLSLFVRLWRCLRCAMMHVIMDVGWRSIDWLSASGRCRLCYRKQVAQLRQRDRANSAISRAGSIWGSVLDWRVTFRANIYGPLDGGIGVSVYSLTSHSTHNRSFRGWFLQARWPNQQCQSTEENQLVVKDQASIPPEPLHHVTVI